MIVAALRNMTLSVALLRGSHLLRDAHQLQRSRGAFKAGPNYRVSGLFRGPVRSRHRDETTRLAGPCFQGDYGRAGALRKTKLLQ